MLMLAASQPWWPGDHLNIVPPNNITIVGVQRLTTLRKLTHFAVFSDDSIDSPMAEWAFFNEVGGLSLQMVAKLSQHRLQWGFLALLWRPSFS